MRIKKMILSTLLLASTSAFADLRIDANLNNLKLNVNGNAGSSLDLLGGVGVRQSLRGQKVQSVIVKAARSQQQAYATKTTYILRINGQAFSQPQEITMLPYEVSLAIPPYVDLSNPLNGMDLVFQTDPGSQQTVDIINVAFYVNDVAPPPTPQPPPPPPPLGGQVEFVVQPTEDEIRGQDTVDFIKELNLGAVRKGQLLQRITLTANAKRQAGDAQLVINGIKVGAVQTITQQKSQLLFDLAPNMRLGEEIRSLGVYVRGEIYLHEMTAEIRSQYGTSERRLEFAVNQLLTDPDGMEMTDFEQIPSRLYERFIESVEIQISGNSSGEILRLCQADANGKPSMTNCGDYTMVPGQGLQSIKLPGYRSTTLENTVLVFRPNIKVESMAINFK